MSSRIEGRVWMLTGSYPMSVDAKGRITLPAVFRKQLVEDEKRTIKLIPYGGRVNGFTPEGFKRFVDGLFEVGGEQYDARDPRQEKLKRGLTARAVEVDIDSAGRVALGKLDASRAGTRERFGLFGEVVVVGADDHFEVWDATEWEAEQESLDEELDALLYHA